MHHAMSRHVDAARRSALFAAAFSALAAGPAIAHDHSRPGEEKIDFERADPASVTVPAYAGAFTVPENRADPDSRAITLRYVRFPATTKTAGPPIVYLAGGPGGSGIATAKGRRFSLFMAMRAFGDVIAFDQRGTGASDGPGRCKSDISYDASKPLVRAEVLDAMRASITQCEAIWAERGVDIAGYTTTQNAADLDALRAHLGAEQLVLWGTSYGSHLAFAAMKTMDDRIARAILSSAEGPNQTVKRPARTDAFFDRIQAAIDADPAAKAAYPDVEALIRRVHAKLDVEPARITIRAPDGGDDVDYVFGSDTAKWMAGFAIGDPSRVKDLLAGYAAMDQGYYEPVGQFFFRMLHGGAPIDWNGMSLAMDQASGITADRAALIAAEADTALLGDFLNFPHPSPHLEGILGGLDEGDAFRAPTVTDTPTLLLSGDLDGRTYIESQLEAVEGFSNLTAVTVKNAGHNLFMSTPAVTAAIEAFMRGDPVPAEITAPTPVFIDPPGDR